MQVTDGVDDNAFIPSDCGARTGSFFLLPSHNMASVRNSGGVFSAVVNVAFLLGTVTLLGAAVLKFRGPDPLAEALRASREAAAELIGNTPPAFAAVAMGSPTTLGGVRERPLALLIGAPSCPGCSELRKTWDSLATIDHRIDYLVVYPHNVPELIPKDSALHASQLAAFTSANSQNDFNRYYNHAFKVIPAVLLFGRNGAIAWAHVGKLTSMAEMDTARHRVTSDAPRSSGALGDSTMAVGRLVR